MTKWIYVLVSYNGYEIKFPIELPTDITLAELEEKLRNDICIEFEK